MSEFTDDNTADPRWSRLYRIGGVAALVSVALIPVQIVVYLVWPPPAAALGAFELFESGWLVGLLSLDLLYVPQNILIVLIWLALYAALHRIDESLMAVALALGLVGIAAYFPSNTAFEMLELSSQFAGAETAAHEAALLAAGEGMLATYVGTTYDVYYVLNGIALLLIAGVMVRSDVFGGVTAYVGVLAGALMVLPASAGTIGLVFALVSLVPWAVFSLLVARRLLRLARATKADSISSLRQ